MQALWMAFENFAGKGIGIVFILKFLWYTMLLVAPQAFPIGVLLSSIMTLGSLSENYEFAAMKSSGISLKRIIRPLLFFTLFLSIVNFMFLNYVYPYAMLKQINLKINVKKKQPALALVPGSFNTEIPNYQIKFDEKYGKEENLLKNVMIYDLSSNRGNNKIITAKEGELVSEEGSRYMTLILKNGNFFEYHVNNSTPYKKRKKMPTSYASFNEYTINIDISSFTDDDLDDLKYTKNYNMLSLAQLKDTLPDMKLNYDEYVQSRAKNLFINVNAEELYKYSDSLTKKELSKDILDNFELEQKENILTTAISKVNRTLDNIKSNKEVYKYKRKILNLYDIEFYNRIALSLACLLLFFIGAPLGSIIRKGGMGLPMILAILIYVTFHFSNTFGRNLAEESSLTAITGSWLSVLIMLPLAVLLTTRATQDKGLFNISSVFVKIRNLISRLQKKGSPYYYNIKVSDHILKEVRTKFENLDENKILNFIQNYIQYDLSKEERQAAILILKERGIDTSNKKKLENIKYIDAINKYNEYKISIIITLPFWIIFSVINTLNPFGIIIKIIFGILFFILLKTSKEILDELNIIMDNKLKRYVNPLLFYGLGFIIFLLIYFTNKDIKENLKSLT